MGWARTKKLTKFNLENRFNISRFRNVTNPVCLVHEEDSAYGIIGAIL